MRRTKVKYILKKPGKEKSIQLPLNAFFFLWRRVNGNGNGTIWKIGEIE